MAQTGLVNYQNQQFNGTGAYSIVNSNGLAGGAALAQPVVYLVGASVGGKPGTVLRLTSEQQARTTLKGGDLLNAYLFARKHGAGEVDAYRVDPATQSSLVLYDASSNPSVLLTSVDYGNYTDSFSASISGTTGALTASFVDAYDSVNLSSPTLGPAFTFTYTGNATSATGTIVKSLSAVGTLTMTASTTGGTIPASTAVSFEVVARNASGNALPSTSQSVTTASTDATNSVAVSWTAITGATSYDVYVDNLYYGNTKTTSITVTSIPSGTIAPPTTATAGPNLNTVLSGQTDGSVDLDISLTSLNVLTVSALASYLSGQIGYEAIVATGAGAISSAQLDAVTAVSLLSPGASITADIAAVISWFNGTGYVTAVQATGGTNAPAAVGLTPFAGGSDGTASVTQWQNAANLVGTAVPQLRYPVVLTSTASYRSLFATAIAAAAALNTVFFSRGFYGGSTSDSDSTAEANAAALGSDRAYYAHPDFYDYDSNGVYTHFPSYILAACYAGLAAGNAPQQPLTNQVLKILALGGLDSSGQPLNATRALALAVAGVSAAYLYTDGTLRIYQGISTDLISGDQLNTYKVEFSVGNAVDAVRIFVDTDIAQKYVGGTNYGTGTYGSLLAELNADLDTCEKTFGWIAGYTGATEIQLASNNSTFLVSNASVNVVNPINGVIFSINLALPPTTATTAA